MYPPARINGSDNTNARVEYWTAKIQHAQTLDQPFHQAREELKKQYYNEAATQREASLDATPLGTDNVARLKPSIIFGFIDQAISNTLARNPKFRVTDRNGGGVKGENFVADTINDDYDITGQKEEDERIMLDAYFGWGVKKIGIILDQDDDVLPDASDFAFENALQENDFLAVGDQVQVLPDQDHKDHNETHGALLSDPDVDEDTKDDVIKPHMRQHTKFDSEAPADSNTRRRVDTPYGERWDPTSFVMDPLSLRGLADARWVAWKVTKPIDEVKANPNYRKSALASLKPTRRMTGAPEAKDIIDDKFGLVDYWEIWSRGTPMGRGKFKNLLVVIAEQGEGENQLLRHDDEWPYDAKSVDHYATLLSFHKGVDTWKAPSLLTMGGAPNIQKIQNEMIDSVLNLMRKSKNILMFDSDIYEQGEIENVLKGGDMAAVGVSGLSEGGVASIRFLPFDVSDFNKLDFTQFIQSLVDKSVGTPQPIASDLDSATEANIVNQRTSAREAARADKFEKMQIETVQKFWSLRVQFGEEDDFIFDATAEEGGSLDETTRRTLRFGIDVSSSAQAIQVEQKTWQDLLNLMTGMTDYSIQRGIMPPRIELIADMLMKRGYDIQNTQEIWPAIGQTAEQQPGIEQVMEIDEQRNQTGRNSNGGGPIANGPAADQRALNRPARDPIRTLSGGGQV